MGLRNFDLTLMTSRCRGNGRIVEYIRDERPLEDRLVVYTFADRHVAEDGMARIWETTWLLRVLSIVLVRSAARGTEVRQSGILEEDSGSCFGQDDPVS